MTQWLLVTSLDGPENIEVDGRSWAIAAGDTYLIQPGQLHTLASPGNRPVWIHFDLSFDVRREQHPHAGPYEAELGRRATFLQPDAPAVWGVPVPVVIPPPLRGVFARGVPHIVTRWSDSTPVAVLEATHHLAGLLVALVAHVMPQEGGAAPIEERIARAERVVRDRLAADMDVTGMATVAGMSRGHFSVVYTRVRGITPARFLRQARLDLAETLLRRDDLPIAAIGPLVGYPDPTVFGRVFRGRHGESPSAWRRRQTR